MLTFGDFNVSGEIVAAIVVLISWIASAIAAIIIKEEKIFEYPTVFSMFVGIGYLMLKLFSL